MQWAPGRRRSAAPLTGYVTRRGRPVHEQGVAGPDDRGGGGLVHDDAVRRLLRGRAGGLRPREQRLAVPPGVDDDARGDPPPVGEHNPVGGAVSSASLDHGDGGQRGVQVRAQPGDVEDGVLPAQVPVRDRDGAAAGRSRGSSALKAP